MSTTNPPPRVLIFPFPGQGHVTPMLNLAELLALSGIQVTFLATEHVHRRLLRHGHGHALAGHGHALAGHFVFHTIPDGLPDNHPRSPETIGELFASLMATAKPSLKHVLASEGNTTCLIADGFYGSFPIDIGDELKIPVIHFRTGSACYLWASFCMPDVIRAGELPIQGEEDRDRVIKSVGGMEGFLRCRDLPDFFQATDTQSNNGLFDYMIGAARSSSRARGLILNSFEHLEGPIISQLQQNCNPNTYALGPLHAHLRDRLAGEGSRPSTSLSEADKSCLAWLDSQPPNSVIYVSFGSVVSPTPDKILEFWHGLVASQKRFLWAVRPGLLSGFSGASVSTELTEATRDRGFVAEWVPQEEVLCHVAVGGFLTHSGWNSTLESLVCGVPMLCWPCHADQQINSRYVGEVWKLGIDMKDFCDREVVAKLVNDLMVHMRDELARSTAEMARVALSSVTPGGSSYRDLYRLIQDLSMMNT